MMQPGNMTGRTLGESRTPRFFTSVEYGKCGPTLQRLGVSFSKLVS